MNTTEHEFVTDNVFTISSDTSARIHLANDRNKKEKKTLTQQVIRALSAVMRVTRKKAKRIAYMIVPQTSNLTASPAKPFTDEFDSLWYLQAYPDVAASGMEPSAHYSAYGKAEGRYPMREVFLRSAATDFDAGYYLQAYPDVAAAGMDPVAHYLAYGKAEGRFASKDIVQQPHLTHFDADWYCNMYPDVIRSGIDPLKHYLSYGKSTGRYPTRAMLLREEKISDFDDEWYLATYPGVARARLPALYHYVTSGRQEGRYPSFRHMIAQDFDASWYLQTYPEVAMLNLDPFEYFIQRGYVEGHLPNPNPRQYRAPFLRIGPSETGARGKPFLYDANVKLTQNFSQTIGVHLHLYYTDLTDIFVKHLNAIPKEFDLFISMPRGKYNAREIENCERQFQSGIKQLKKLVIKETNNIGRDIYPFLVEFGQELLAYDLILHLHSKKSPQTQAKGWRQFLLHYTLGNESIVTQILNSFNDDTKLGAIFPAYFHATMRQPMWGGNRQIVRDQLSRLGYNCDLTYCPDYPAGSFFWARSDAIRPLLNATYNIEDFDEEAGQYDGTLAHGLERLFGVIPGLRNYSTMIRFVDKDYMLCEDVDLNRD